MALQKVFPGIQKVSDEIRHDDDLDMDYRSTSWNLGGHKIDVNVEIEGPSRGMCRARVDGGTASDSLDEGGLLSWLCNLLGR